VGGTVVHAAVSPWEGPCGFAMTLSAFARRRCDGASTRSQFPQPLRALAVVRARIGIDAVRDGLAQRLSERGAPRPHRRSRAQQSSGTSSKAPQLASRSEHPAFSLLCTAGTRGNEGSTAVRPEPPSSLGGLGHGSRIAIVRRSMATASWTRPIDAVRVTAIMAGVLVAMTWAGNSNGGDLISVYGRPAGASGGCRHPRSTGGARSPGFRTTCWSSTPRGAAAAFPSGRSSGRDTSDLVHPSMR